jgi:D-beta-D-heptose 7-phosphate kinase / D-beta-D-heptose 1-phosphate adenosyltransferase
MREGRPAPLLVVGDALLDRDMCGRADRLAPDAPVPVVEECEERVRPGGAALAALLAASDGREVTLVAALGDDPASRRLRELLTSRIRVVALPLEGDLPEKTRLMAGGRAVARLDRGDGRAAAATEEAEAATAAASAVLVADYGRGTADMLRRALTRAAHHTPVVWDPHPRGGPPVPNTRLATPTASEARRFVAQGERARALPPGSTQETARAAAPSGLWAAARDARALARMWRAASVAVTLGEQGVLLVQGGSPLLVPAPERHAGDACGAGDRFAATAAGLLADGALPEEAVRAAVPAATDYVAAGGSASLAAELARGGPAHAGVLAPGAGRRRATPAREPADPFEVVERVRSRHGTVVATGGCFDLLHAGHIGLLQSARHTGDCLVVCLNSDASVRRRKGEGRPITPLADRMRVLRALECVDAVAVFDEDTPERLLSRLRPDLWVKGGDYALEELPEAALLEQWGGQTLLLPYLDGRSTTRITARVRGGDG